MQLSVSAVTTARVLLTQPESISMFLRNTTLAPTVSTNVSGSSGVAKGGPSRARPDQSSVVPYQVMFNYLPLYTLNIHTYR